MSSCAATVQPLQPIRSGPVPRMRHGQTPSGTLRYSLKRSASILVQPSSSAMTVTTASRATYTLHCFNGLQQPKRPSRPHSPKEPQWLQGWMLSFDSRLPIHQLYEKSHFFSTFLRFCDTDVTFSLKFQRKVTSSIPYATRRREFFYFSSAEAM